MARIWKERLDPSRHRNHMYPTIGGYPIAAPKDNLIERWIYCVRVCSFTFEFENLKYMTEALRYFSQKPLPSSGKSGGKALEPEWRAWHERIPMYLKEEPKRQKIVKALAQAVEKFGAPQP